MGCRRLLIVDTDGPYLQAMKVVLNEAPGDWGSMVSRMADEHIDAAVFSEITEDREGDSEGSNRTRGPAAGTARVLTESHYGNDTGALVRR